VSLSANIISSQSLQNQHLEHEHSFLLLFIFQSIDNSIQKHHSILDFSPKTYNPIAYIFVDEKICILKGWIKSPRLLLPWVESSSNLPAQNLLESIQHRPFSLPRQLRYFYFSGHASTSPSSTLDINFDYWCTPHRKALFAQIWNNLPISEQLGLIWSVIVGGSGWGYSSVVV
jgi:hypothetical protein